MSLFKKFSELEPAREEIPQIVSDLEKILNVEKEIVIQYKNDERGKHDPSQEYAIYGAILRDSKEKLEGIKITQNHILDYLSARENEEIDHEAKIRGMFSGALLEISSQTEKEISINGRGKKWNYLFYHVKNIHDVTVENFTGSKILTYMGSYLGHAKNITIKNIKGFDTLSYAGSEGGIIENIYLENLSNQKGERAEILRYIAQGGRAENIVGKNLRGDFIFSLAGSNNGTLKNISLTDISGLYVMMSIGDNNGFAENITLIDIESDFTLNATGESGTVRNVKIVNNRGDGLLANQTKGKNGILENVFIAGSLGKNILRSVGQYGTIVKKIVLQDITGDNILAHSGYDGNVQNVFGTNISGTRMLSNAGQSSPSGIICLTNFKPVYKVQNILVVDSFTDELLIDAGEDSRLVSAVEVSATEVNTAKSSNTSFELKSIKHPILNVLTDNITGRNNFHHATIENKKTADSLPSEKKNILKKIKLIVQKMKEKTVQEQKAMHKKIEQLQKELFADEK